MAKSKGSFGRFLAFATIAGAVAAGISYFTKYRSFHKELEEDFHDFEDDCDDYPVDSTMSRNYVPINSNKPGETEKTFEQMESAEAEAGEDEFSEDGSSDEESSEAGASPGGEAFVAAETPMTEAAGSEPASDEDVFLDDSDEDEDDSFLDLDEEDFLDDDFEAENQTASESEPETDHIKKIDPQPAESVNTIIVEEFQ